MTNFGTDDHVDDLRLPYIEGLLNPAEKSQFEDHIRTCADCESKLEEMRQSVSTLTENRQAMCPEPWELFEYARSGRGPVSISSHLDKCQSCAGIAASFKAQYSRKGMPADLWAKMKDLAGEQRTTRHTQREWFTELLDSLLNFLRPVALVPAAVAVAALVLVIVYTTEPRPTTVALSSVNWAPTSSDLNLLGKPPSVTPPSAAKKERLAIVILLSNFKHLPNQSDIDSFYRSVEPPVEIRDQYELVSPAQVGQAIGKDLAKRADEKFITEEMRSALGVSRLLAIAIIESGPRFGIRARLIDTASSSSIMEQDVKNLTSDELGLALEKMALGTLTPESAKQ